MKAIILAFALFVLVLCPSAVFAEDWTTTDGKTYQDVKVVRVQDDAVTIVFKDGGALVPLQKLPPDLQKKYNYDPVKAKAAADARTAADAESARELEAEILAADKLKRDKQIADATARGFTNSGTNKPPK